MMPRISFAVALVLLLVASGCATGKPAPATTPMAKVTDGLTFQFGMGGQGCGIPQTATSCTADHKFDPGEPAVMVKVKPFAIDIHEVTVEQYRYCQEYGVCSLPAGDNGPSGVPDYYTNKTYNNRPAVLVTWYQAEQFCEFMGKRLPTEFEWERVAGGPAQSTADKRLYSFVDKLGPDAAIPSPCQKNVNIQGCNSGLTDTRDVMSSTDDVVSVGSSQVWDVSGNVSEWTASDDDPANPSITCDYSKPGNYDCEACVKCISNYGADSAKCKGIVADPNAEADCPSCVCGDGSTATSKPNCYTPCDTPVCPLYPAGTVLDKSYTGKNFAARRIIRGASYNDGLAGTNVVCASRSDARSFAIKPGDAPLLFVGFRCAKSL